MSQTAETPAPSAPPAAPARPTLQGLVATKDDEKALLDALEQAFDYRGDVSLTLTDGASVTGYLFDRRTGPTLEQSSVRLLPADSNDKRTVRYSDIARLEFTGRDTAHGKTFENWIKRYVEARTKGQTASIESERLD